MTRNAKAKEPQPTPKLGIALDSSEIVLSTLANAAKLTPVPYIQDAAGVALALITVIQNVKSNKEAFQRLADDACALVYIVLCSNHKAVGAATVTPAYLDHARDLVDTLQEIYNYAKCQTSRSRILRIIQHKSDAGTIQDYRNRLKHSLDVFSLKSSMSVQRTLASIQEQLELFVRENGPDSELRENEAQVPASARITPSAQDGGVDMQLAAVESPGPTGDTEMHSDAGQVEEGKRQTRPGDPEYTAHQTNHVPGPLPTSQPNPFFEQYFASLTSASTRHRPHSVGGSFLSVGGDQNSYTGSVINTNSGNTTSHVVTNSNNDSSSRTYRGSYPSSPGESIDVKCTSRVTTTEVVIYAELGIPELFVGWRLPPHTLAHFKATIKILIDGS